MEYYNKPFWQSSKWWDMVLAYVPIVLVACKLLPAEFLIAAAPPAVHLVGQGMADMGKNKKPNNVEELEEENKVLLEQGEGLDEENAELLDEVVRLQEVEKRFEDVVAGSPTGWGQWLRAYKAKPTDAYLCQFTRKQAQATWKKWLESCVKGLEAYQSDMEKLGDSYFIKDAQLRLDGARHNVDIFLSELASEKAHPERGHIWRRYTKFADEKD